LNYLEKYLKTMKKIKIKKIENWLYECKRFPNADFEEGVNYAKKEIHDRLQVEKGSVKRKKFEKFNKKMTNWQTIVTQAGVKN